MRKILAVLCTILTLFAIKETVYLFFSNDVGNSFQKTQLELAALSITIPLFVLSAWLWITSRKTNQPK